MRICAGSLPPAVKRRLSEVETAWGWLVVERLWSVVGGREIWERDPDSSRRPSQSLTVVETTHHELGRALPLSPSSLPRPPVEPKLLYPEEGWYAGIFFGGRRSL